LQMLCDSLQRRRDRGVYEDALVLGVVDHELEVFGEEARVQRMQHRARAGYREVELEVTVVVPGQCANPGSGGNPELFERVRQLGHPPSEIGVGVAVAAALPPSHDLLPGEEGGGPPEEVLERQGK